MSTDTENSRASKTPSQLSHDELVEEELGDSKVKIYGLERPQRPPAILGIENKEAIWWEEIEDPVEVQSIAERSNTFEAENKDLVIKIVFEDFTEFFFPINSSGKAGDSQYESLEDEYKGEVSSHNDEFNYDSEVSELNLDSDVEEKEDVDFASLLEEDDKDENADIELDINW